MLDDVIGEGFSLLGVGIDSSVMRSLSLGEAWDALIARRVALSISQVPMFAAHTGMLLLVRPDRYIMARFKPTQAPRIAEELAALLAQTWPAGKAGEIAKGGSSGIRTVEPEVVNHR